MIRHHYPSQLTPWTQSYRGRSRCTDPGACAIVILAGGVGSRFGGPKALYPITPLWHKNLLEVLLEKIEAAATAFQRHFPVFLYMSPATYAPITAYVQQRTSSLKIYPLMQDERPYKRGEEHVLDAQGNPLLAPDGNGSIYRLLCESPYWKAWEWVHTIAIDNPLCDPLLLDFQPWKKGHDLLIGVQHCAADASMGRCMSQQGRLVIMEYNAGHVLTSRLGYTGMVCAHRNFVQRAATHTLPWRGAYKMVPGYGRVWKQEQWIIDTFPCAHRPATVRLQHQFAPLKNRTGTASRATVQRALWADYRRRCPIHYPCELGGAWYYPCSTQQRAAALIKKDRG